MTYRAEIDGLRALAVLPVILFHAGFQWFSGGFVGVDVFFVISGYLITTIIINEIAEGDFSLMNFYERRARRILPALFFVMFACLPFAWLWLKPADLQDFGRSLIAVAMFCSNMLFWLESGYFETAAELKPLLHTWSLAVEEQYYVLFPLFLMLTWKLGVKRILLLFGILFALSLGAAHWATAVSTDESTLSGAFFLLPTRGWELLVGVIAAFYLRYKGPPTSSSLNQVLSLLGIGMILYSIFVFDKDTAFPGLYALLPTIGTGLLILAANSGTIVYTILGWGPLVGLGLISYSAYLWHQPVLAFARHRFSGDLSNELLLGLCLASIAMAYLSWRAIEKPFRDKNRVSRIQVVRFSLLGILLFTSIGLVLQRREVLEESAFFVNPQITGGDIGHDEFFTYAENEFPVCEDSVLVANAEDREGFIRCRQTRSGEPTIAVFGDSHAEHLFPGLAKNLDQNAIYLIRAGFPALGEESHDYLIDFLESEDRIETVIYTMHWWRKLQMVGDERFRTGIYATLKHFVDSEKQVVVVADVPEYPLDASDCYFIPSYSEPGERCEIKSDDFEEQLTYLTVVSEIAADLDIELIDPSGLFCDDDKCSMIRDGLIMYRDHDHLNIPGSALVGRFIASGSTTLNAE